MDYLNKIEGIIPPGVTEKHLFYFIVSTQVLNFIWEWFLAHRQRAIYKTYVAMPDSLIGITKRDTYEKARVYALDKSRFGAVQDTFDIILNLIVFYLDGIALAWNLGGDLLRLSGLDGKNEIIRGVAFLIVINTFSILIKMPFSVYYTFVLEEKHGFNKQTAGFFVKDKIKSYILMQVLASVMGSGVTYIVMIGGQYFFLYLWLFCMGIMFFFMTIYPDLIAPLFDKYTPLPDGELRSQIENLAASINFPLTKLYIVEGSKRSSHSNAYFYGFFKNKRIVLFDTLLQKEGDETGKGCSENEILAVLGHELGHWKLNHVLKNIIIVQINMLIMFMAFAALFKYKPLYASIGFTDTPILIGLIVITQYVLAPYFFLLSLVMSYLSRQFEFAADRFAKDLGRCYALKAALIKLNADNLSFPIYDSLYSAFHNSHPPLLERLEALDSTKEE